MRTEGAEIYREEEENETGHIATDVLSLEIKCKRAKISE